MPRPGPIWEWRLPVEHNYPKETGKNSTTPSRTQAASQRTERQADGRDGRVVGDNSDSVADSFGKAIVAPFEGADEGAEPVDAEHVRAYVDLTRTRPQGQDKDGNATAPKPAGKAL